MCNEKIIQVREGDDGMDTAVKVKRPCSVTESVKQSCMEVKRMREGKAPKKSLDELFENITQWGREGRD